MNKEEFEAYIVQWEESFKKEYGDDIDEDLEEITKSAGQPNFEKVLFDERTKGVVRIQYGRRGGDYIYHIFFKKDPAVQQFVIFDKIWQAIAKLLPREPEKVVSPPQRVTEFKDPYYIDCYTLLVKDIVKFNGSRRMMEEVFVSSLLNILCELFPVLKQEE